MCRKKALPVWMVLVPVFFLILPVEFGHAQDRNLPQVDFWAVFQPRLSYGVSDAGEETIERLGYGIRRARFRVTMDLKNKVGIQYDSDFASGAFQTVDVFGYLNVSPEVRVRLGVMASAQPRAHILTGIPVIDGVDRAAIAERWAGATIGGGGRDFGVDLQYQTADWTLIAFLHNGDGSFNRSRSNYSQTISSGSATAGVDRTVLATSAYAAYRPPSLQNVEFGGYLSNNPSRNPNTENAAGTGREFFSYAAHAYYGPIPGSQVFRLKFDLIGINYRGEGDQESLGVSLLGAVLVNEYTEFFARYENAQADVSFEGDDFVSVGASFSLSKLRGGNFNDQRATLGYSLLDGAGGGKEHLLVLQVQLVLP